MGTQDAPGMVGTQRLRDSLTYRANATSINRWLNTSNNYALTAMSYDIAGNVVSVQDPNGHVTRLGYNDDGSNQYALATSVVNALN